MQISVIIPCHNAARWIRDTLRSVANQTHLPHEIIVIDDDSADGSLAAIEQSNIAVKLLRVKANNAAIARNAGIEVASGNWIALLDADDVWYPHHLSRAVSLLANSNDVAFMSDHDWIGLEGEAIEVPQEFQCKLKAPKTGMDIRGFFKLTTEGFHFGHSTVLYRADRLRAVGMFDPSQRRRHDSDLWIRMIAGKTWTYDTVKSIGYRENTPGSISKNEAECDYFYLRALVKNLPLAPCDEYRTHLAREARRVMGIAFVDREGSYYDSIRELAWQYLPLKYRYFYQCAALCPSVARGLIRAKRRIVVNHGRNDGSSGANVG
jgi:glycosyltransferase involved in cell wall biosynthesis